MAAGCSQAQVASPAVVSNPPATTSKITYRLLNSFTGFYGSHPSGTLAQYNLLLFGTAAAGGSANQGALFRLNPDGKDPRPVHSLNGGKDGCEPVGGFVYSDRSRVFYGTAKSCGNSSKGGTVYSLSVLKTFHVMHAFDPASDGGNPEGGLLVSGTTLYGTTPNGGARGKGTLYSVDINTDVFTVLHAFGAGHDAAQPVSGLIEVGGKLFGTSRDGGLDGSGTVYEFDPRNGDEKVVHSFDGSDGARPTAAVLWWGGMLYGVTPKGGINSAGILFKIDPASGDETVLYNFGHGDALAPEGALIAYKDRLYGTTRRGGSNGKDLGTIFRYTPAAKSYEELYAFAGKPDGAHPRGGLFFERADRQDQLFGTTYEGGANNLGTVYSVVP